MKKQKNIFQIEGQDTETNLSELEICDLPDREFKNYGHKDHTGVKRTM